MSRLQGKVKLFKFQITILLLMVFLVACSGGNHPAEKVVDNTLEEPFPPVVKKAELHPAEQAVIEFIEAAYIHQDVERVAKIIKVGEEDPPPDQDGFFEEVRGMGKPESYIDGYRPLKPGPVGITDDETVGREFYEGKDKKVVVVYLDRPNNRELYHLYEYQVEKIKGKWLVTDEKLHDVGQVFSHYVQEFERRFPGTIAEEGWKVVELQ